MTQSVPAKKVTASDLLELHKIKDEHCDAKIADVHLEKISRILVCEMQSLAPYIGIEYNLVADIEKQNVGWSTKKHTFLLKWRETKGRQATYRSLIKGLVDIEYIGNAEGVCELLVATDSTQDEIERASTAGIITIAIMIRGLKLTSSVIVT